MQRFVTICSLSVLYFSFFYVKYFSANGTFINYKCLNPKCLRAGLLIFNTATSYVSSIYFLACSFSDFWLGRRAQYCQQRQHAWQAHYMSSVCSQTRRTHHRVCRTLQTTWASVTTPTCSTQSHKSTGFNFLSLSLFSFVWGGCINAVQCRPRTLGHGRHGHSEHESLGEEQSNVCPYPESITRIIADDSKDGCGVTSPCGRWVIYMIPSAGHW